MKRKFKECLNSMKRGFTMPAFTFEKLSPPERRGPVPPVANKKQRGVIVQMLDRFAEARVKRDRQQQAASVPDRYKPPE
jgi:hypothetical protein